MFSREHHRRIAALLNCLDKDQLLKHRCYFSGGTAVALRHGEYRDSSDIDFLCSSVDGYREIRQAVDETDQSWLFKQPVTIHRGIRVDQYGIRLFASLDGDPIKVEITFEGRVALNDPVPQDSIEGVWALSDEDLVATKLMANADRYAEDAMMSRDLIDLAMMTPDGRLPRAGVVKARAAYGRAIDRDFARAKELLLGREGRLAKCMQAMEMTMPIEDLFQRIDQLKLDWDQKPKGRPLKLR